ncbi:MAG: DUF3332 family protein [Luteibaculaceae bacterium]
MKKLKLRVVSFGMLGLIGLTTTNCLGEFKLTRMLYEFNTSISDNKFVNNLVFWAANIIPVYAVVVFVDVVILNLIEFWSGSNPLSMEEGQEERMLVPTETGLYELTASKNKFEIKGVDGEAANYLAELLFFPEDKSWNLNQNDQLIKLNRLVTVNGVEQIEIFLPEGKSVFINANETDKNYVMQMVRETMNLELPVAKK